jgi:hypothetical protein
MRGSALNIDEAMAERQRHRPAPDDWAALCTVCGQPAPCAAWRKASLVIIEGVAAAFTGARKGEDG